MSPTTTTSTAAVLLLSAALLLSTATTTSAFNITRLLGQYPEYSQFNDLLTQTHLNVDINRRRTITVLALTNDNVGVLAGKSLDVIKQILSVHVVLDYYDTLKLSKLTGNRTEITTHYQESGVADDRQGFLRVAHNKDGIFFGSAMAGAPIDAKLEASVASQPYNISVLSISHPIIAPGIDGTLLPPRPSPPPAAPKSAPPAQSPAEEEVQADAPTPTSVESPPPADTPAPGPADDDEVADSPPTENKNKNAAGKKMAGGVSSGLIVVMTLLVSLWV